MPSHAVEPVVRVAQPADVPEVARLLHRFNLEYDDPTPGVAVLTERLRSLLCDDGDSVALLVGDSPDGVALLRFRPGLWSAGAECYLAELYVVPERRGRGLGRAVMVAALHEARLRGAATMDLGTSESDVAAVRLYESLGFINREGGPGGPVMYVYERDL